MEDDFISTVVAFYKQNKWQKILKQDSTSDSARKLLWVWPDEDVLHFIKNTVDTNSSKGIISIGCGSGLFEWLLHKCTVLPVIGYEVNKEWWLSKYCSPQFIKLQFLEMPPKGHYLKKDHALMFCYFNNGPAFLDYINVYEGNLVFIIGPAQGEGRHTNPAPFNANLDNTWKLYSFREVKKTRDFVAAYVRTEQQQN